MAEMSLEQRQYLTAKFKEFIAAVHSSHESNLPVRTPYQWQIRLMLYVAEHGYWPRSIGAPTASGKTSVIDIHVFLNAMAGCRAYASTAGFESICEAMYLGKPVLMVPAHIEQDCNAYDAMKAGAGIISDSFDLQPLLRFAGEYTPNRHFVYWVRSCERRMIRELEKLAASHSEITSIPTFTNYLPI